MVGALKKKQLLFLLFEKKKSYNVPFSKHYYSY